MDKENDQKKQTPDPINSPIDSLLPPAQIHLFSNDEQTKNTFQELTEDWRFGRISMSVRGENLDEAITHYSRRKSPTLIIIQTETTDEAFQKKLEELSGVCGEETAAIVIGPVNDVQLYRHLTGMGISDYLVKPVSPTDMLAAIASSLQDIVGAVDSHLMAVYGIKGGVGATSVAAMMAHILSDSFHAKTLILDASGGASTLWTHFGFAPSGTLIEAARAIVDKDDDAFKRLIIKKGDYLHVMNCGAESIMDNPIAAQAFEMLLDKCLTLYPNVVLDLSRAPVQLTRMVMARANSIALVATPRVPDLSITKLMLKDLRELPGAAGRHPFIIINKSAMVKSTDISASDAAEALQTENVATLDWDAALFGETENSGEFIAERGGFVKYQSTLIPIIEKITGYKPVKDEAVKKDFLSFLKGGK